MWQGQARHHRLRGVAGRFRTLAMIAVVGMTGLLVGCQSDEPAGALVDAVAEARPELVDSERLLTRYEFVLPAPEAEVLPHIEAPVDDHAVAIPGPDGAATRVVWAGLPCQTAPFVELTREDQRVVVAVTRGPKVLGADDDCTANEVAFAIDLVFADHVTDAPMDAHVR
jgi:hypothetical protein